MSSRITESGVPGFWRIVRRPSTTSALAFVLGLSLAHASSAQAPAPNCAPREGEKLGVRFVEVCAGRTADFADAEAHGDQPLPAFWVAAVPLPCSAGAHDTVACDRVTALEASPGFAPGKNAVVNALLVSADLAHRTCTLRFGGRLPTPLEREHARRTLGLATLLVREASGAPARIRLDDLPEWVAEGDCASSPSMVAPDCRITQFPPVVARPRSASDVVLQCRAERTPSPTHDVRTGSECAEGAAAEGLRHPDCSVRVADGGPAFDLRCSEVPRSGETISTPELAGFRCVLPESGLGRVAGGPASEAQR